jgi:hypothetical protein
LLKTELHDDYLGEDLGAYGTLRVEVLELDQEDCDFSVGDVGNGLADSLNLEVDLKCRLEDQEGRIWCISWRLMRSGISRTSWFSGF